MAEEVKKVISTCPICDGDISFTDRLMSIINNKIVNQVKSERAKIDGVYFSLVTITRYHKICLIEKHLSENPIKSPQESRTLPKGYGIRTKGILTRAEDRPTLPKGYNFRLRNDEESPKEIKDNGLIAKLFSSKDAYENFMASLRRGK